MASGIALNDFLVTEPYFTDSFVGPLDYASGWEFLSAAGTILS